MTRATKTIGPRELPILFNGPMVSAIWEGRKTQTRRICKQARDEIGTPAASVHPDGSGSGWIAWWPEPVSAEDTRRLYPESDGFKPPYRVGDRLWVRETYYRFGHWEQRDGRKLRESRRRRRWVFVPDTEEILYAPPENYRKGRHSKDPDTPAWHRRPSMFMPRTASRITLEVTDVRVQRVQEIGEADAESEGIIRNVKLQPNPDSWNGIPQVVVPTQSFRESFSCVWDSIHGPGAFERNDWVFAYTFRVVAAASKGGPA